MVSSRKRAWQSEHKVADATDDSGGAATPSFPSTTAPTTPTACVTTPSTWTTRRSTLHKLSSEIDFAFRPSASSAEQRSNDQSSTHLMGTTTTSIQAGDYLDALRLSDTTAAEAQYPVRFVLRENKDSQLDNLVWDVNDLRQHVQHLRDHKRALRTRGLYRSIATRDKVFDVVHAYFSTFADGFERGPTAQQHESFLRSIVVRDRRICSKQCGIVARVVQWRRYMDLFALRGYTLQSIQAASMDTRPILHISCAFTLHITHETLEELFPHIVSDPFCVQKVVGQRLHCESRVTFVFNEHGKIVRYDDDIDLVVAFYKLLRDPFALAKLMDGALIQETSLLGELQ